VPEVVVNVVTLVVVDVVDVVEAVAVGVVDGVVVLVAGVEADLVTVLVVVDPHPASARSAAAASRKRPVTRGSICGARPPLPSSALSFLSWTSWPSKDDCDLRGEPEWIDERLEARDLRSPPRGSGAWG
jgi:hypothetical protein